MFNPAASWFLHFKMGPIKMSPLIGLLYEFNHITCIKHLVFVI